MNGEPFAYPLRGVEKSTEVSSFGLTRVCYRLSFNQHLRSLPSVGEDAAAPNPGNEAVRTACAKCCFIGGVGLSCWAILAQDASVLARCPARYTDSPAPICSELRALKKCR
jgi:hypothetical protein